MESPPWAYTRLRTATVTVDTTCLLNDFGQFLAILFDECAFERLFVLFIFALYKRMHSFICVKKGYLVNFK